MVMPVLDVSANFVSTFAFILVLGIVVDDAIIVGENIFRHREAHGDKLRSAIEGAREIATPVVFAVLTTIAAFSPMLFVPGQVGKVARFVPLVVVPCLLFSLVECLAILPAHLAHTGAPRQGAWRRFQKRIADGLNAVGRSVYRPGLAFALRWRYLALAVGVATLVVTAGIVLSGRVAFHFFPAPEAELITGSVTLPEGTPVGRDVGRGGQARGGGAAAPTRRPGTDRTGRLPPRLCGRRGPADGGRGSRDGHCRGYRGFPRRAGDDRAGAGGRARSASRGAGESLARADRAHPGSYQPDLRHVRADRGQRRRRHAGRSRRRAAHPGGRRRQGATADLRGRLRHRRHVPAGEGRAQARHHASRRDGLA